MVIAVAILALALTGWFGARRMSASFDRLSSLIDTAITKLEAPVAPGSGTSDADLDTLSDKLQAALAPTTAPSSDVVS